MYAENPLGRASDFRAYLRGVKLLYRDPSDQPSIQLAVWAEATLPAGAYRVRFRELDQQFEVTGGAAGPGVLLATWPTPGVVGEPLQPPWPTTVEQVRALIEGPVREPSTVVTAPSPLLLASEDC